jgi:hypothetical protein
VFERGHLGEYRQQHSLIVDGGYADFIKEPNVEENKRTADCLQSN